MVISGKAALAVLAMIAASCSTAGSAVSVAPLEEIAATSTPVSSSTTSTSTSTTSTTAAPTTSTSTSTTSTTAAPTTSTASSTTRSSTTLAPGPAYNEQNYVPYALVEGVELVHPAARVEIIGFHEAGHDGSKQQELLGSATESVTLETRGRGTGSRTAADIVVDPDAEIRSPVTGTVLRGGTYVLYCEYSDDFVVIEPDAQPGWEVKMFHFSGIQVSVGDHVEAGVTVIAPQATPLPFESQVDEFTATPSNPHVHVEILDPRIPDIPTPGGGC